MNTNEIVELEELLSEALKSLTIQQGQSENLSVPKLRLFLQKCRTNYEPNLSRFISLYKPEISHSEVKQKLLGFVNRQLTNHVRDGKIHSATIAFAGGLSSGSPVEDVVRNLLRCTIVDGPAKAAQAFAGCVNNASCNFYSFFLITGVSIAEPVEVFEGITLIPLPESAPTLPPHLPNVPTEADRYGPIILNDLLGKTLVRVEYEVSPIFHMPAETYTFESGPDQHFSVKFKGQEIPDPNLNTLCQALSVVARCRVQSVMNWSSLLDYEIFDLSTSWGIGGSGYGATIPVSGLGDTVQLSPSQMETIKTVYMGLTQLPTETWEKLRIPIDRLAKSMAEEDPIDQMIDLGIALESLYVPESQVEVSYRLAIHAAWHLGNNKVERRRLLKEFRRIYDARSKAVHTGKLTGKKGKPLSDASSLVSRAQELCWRGISSIIEAGEIPDWRDLAMGEDLDSGGRQTTPSSSPPISAGESKENDHDE